MPRTRAPQPGLFEQLEVEEDREKPECPHRHEDATETDWGPPYGRRLTATCRACGHVRGRAGAFRKTA